MAKSEDVPEAAVDPQTRELIQWAVKILYWIAWPIAIGVYYLIYYVCFALLFVAKLVYRPLEFVLLPILYLLRFFGECSLAPFRFLAQFEVGLVEVRLDDRRLTKSQTLYIYLGIAAIVGIALGLFISFVYEVLRKPLGLNSQAQPNRTAKQYREEKRRRRAKVETPLITAGYLSPSNLSLSDGMRKGKRGKGLSSQIIMEELDSDY